MEFVVDANIIFSALIRDSHTRHFLLLSSHSFFVPEFVFDEISKHIQIIKEKSGISENEIKLIFNEILTFGNIKIIPFDDFKQHWEDAKKISPDPDDIHYFALALN